MRPRQSSLGILAASSEPTLDELASMRPRQSSLGIWKRAVAEYANMIRFNEAEAIKPRNLLLALACPAGTHASMRPRQSSLGIWPPLPVPRTTLCCFNEAEAIKPRNLGSCAARKNRGNLASMRPRQSSLGIGLATARIKNAVASLQ